MLTLLSIPALTLLVAAFLFWMAFQPSRAIYLIPLLLSFEYRMRFSSFSFDLCELSLFIAAFVFLLRRWSSTHAPQSPGVLTEGWLILLLAIFALPAIFFESNTAHAASVYRDFLLPFLFFAVFAQAELEKRKLLALLKLAVAFALANAGFGIVQYFTGRYLWFAGPDEAEWQAYKTGLAKLSIFGDWLGVQDTLPTGLYTGANMFACFLSVPLCLTTALAFSPDLAKSQRRACLAAAVFMFICLLFTMFRSGLLVYAASLMAVYLYLGRRRTLLRLFTIAVLASILAVLFLTQGLFDWDQFGSFEGRQDMISAAFALLRAHPELLLTGGFNDLYHLQSKEMQEIHNLALYSIVQFGLPATVLFFAFVIRWIRRILRAARAASGLDRTLLVSIVASIAANVFLYGSSTMLIDSVQTSVWLMFWIAIAHGLAAHITASAKQPSPAFVHHPTWLPARGAAL